MEYSWRQPELSSVGDVDAEYIEAVIEKYIVETMVRIENENLENKNLGLVLKDYASTILEHNTGDLFNELRYAAWFMTADSLTPESTPVNEIELNDRAQAVVSGAAIAYLTLNQKLFEEGVKQFRINERQSPLLSALNRSQEVQRNDALVVCNNLLAPSLSTYNNYAQAWEQSAGNLKQWYEADARFDDVGAGIGYLINRLDELYGAQRGRWVETAPFITYPEERLNRLFNQVRNIQFVSENAEEIEQKIEAITESEEKFFVRFHDSALRMIDSENDSVYSGYFRGINVLKLDDGKDWQLAVMYQPDKAEKETYDSWEYFTFEPGKRVEFYEYAGKSAMKN